MSDAVLWRIASGHKHNFISAVYIHLVLFEIYCWSTSSAICGAFLMGVTPSLPLLWRSSRTALALHLRCPLDCRRPEIPAPHAGVLQNSQRPEMTKQREALKGKGKIKLIIHIVPRGLWTFPYSSHYYPPAPPLSLKQTEIVVQTTGCMWMSCQTRAMKHQVSV